MAKNDLVKIRLLAFSERSQLTGMKSLKKGAEVMATPEEAQEAKDSKRWEIVSAPKAASPKADEGK